MKKNWMLAGCFGLLAAVIYFASLAEYAFPGLSAHLLVCWQGLDSDLTVNYPLMSAFARLLGGGNLIAPISGIIATMAIFYLVANFLSWRVKDLQTVTAQEKTRLPHLAAMVTATVFMLTPAVRGAATHAEPTLFAAAWALAAFALAGPFFRCGKGMAWLFYVLFGALFGLGMCDSAIFLALLPLALLLVVLMAKRHEQSFYLPAFVFLAAGFLSMLVGCAVLGTTFGDVAKAISAEIGVWRAMTVTGFVVLFAILPFFAILLSSGRAFAGAPTLVQWIFNCSMAFVSILAIVTPLSPSKLLEPYCRFPIVSSAMAAMVAGYLVAYWYHNLKKAVSIVAGGIYAFALVAFALVALFVFDGDAGAFADKVAQRILGDLGSRTWFVSDGLIDDHLRLVAAHENHPIKIISLNKDLDQRYLAKLSEEIRRENLGGERNGELRISLSLGVLTFLQDWLTDNPEAAREVAIFGAPDIWYSVNLKPVPELLFFGADENVEPDWSAWSELDRILKAPKGWGSYHEKTTNPMDRLRLMLRRHVGFVANNRGVYLQDKGKDDEAFKMYELVLNEIDRDNICAIFNEVNMVGRGNDTAAAKQRDLERILKGIVADQNRRYLLWRLGTYYGYIRNPETFIRLGHLWARSGRPGEALSQIRRAIDLVPTDKRSVLLNMMAALYANENDQKRSREIYESVLSANERDHDALVGLMRLELADGNAKKALEYLERASAASGDTPQAKIEQAMVALMKNELSNADALLRKAIDQNVKNLQAWSLLAAVTMQRIDAAADAKEQAAMLKKLENEIVPAMEKYADGDTNYYLQTTKGFLLLRQNQDPERRRAARDAFAVAAKSRPDIVASQDMVLGLDISLNDKEDAERRAKEILRRNRNAPLANYVLGSLALGRGDNEQAAFHLRKAATAPKPVLLALNDLAEVLRRQKDYNEAERFARQAVKQAPNLYVAWETLGSVLMDAGRDLDEAESCIRKACQLSKDGNGNEADVRMLISLARVQLARKDELHAKVTIRKVRARLDELSDFEKKEFEEIVKRAH